MRTEKMNRCVMECDSNVTTDESVYRSMLMEVQEWPLGWPNSTTPSPERGNRKSEALAVMRASSTGRCNTM